jgi:hypothetical protein
LPQTGSGKRFEAAGLEGAEPFRHFSSPHEKFVERMWIPKETSILEEKGRLILTSSDEWFE